MNKKDKDTLEPKVKSYSDAKGRLDLLFKNKRYNHTILYGSGIGPILYFLLEQLENLEDEVNK